MSISLLELSEKHRVGAAPAPAAAAREPWTKEDEEKFREWYAKIARENELNPDPDHPKNFYDYRAAYRAGAEPKREPAYDQLLADPELGRLNFVQRINEPDKWPSLDLGGGQTASHKMASAEVDGVGIVYPTVVYDEKTKSLRELDQQEAIDHALETGEVIRFTDPEEADRFAKTYKEKHWPSEFKRPGHPNRYVEGEDTITGAEELPMDSAVNEELRKSALFPRAFQRLPPEEAKPEAEGEGGLLLELSKRHRVEPGAQAELPVEDYVPPLPPEQAMPTVSQLPGVIPQEDVMPPETDTYPEAALKGIARGFRAIPREGLNTALALGAGNIPAGPTAGLGPYAGMALEKAAEYLQDPVSIQAEGEYSKGKEFIAGIAQGIPQVLGMYALGGPAGSAAATLRATTFAFTQEAGAAYEQAIAAGASPAEASKAAIVNGVINGALEYAPVRYLYNRLAGKKAVTAIGHVIGQAVAEGTTGAAQEVTNELTALAIYAENKDLEWPEVEMLITDPAKRGQVLMAGSIEGTLGGGVGVLTAKSAVAATKAEQAKQAAELEARRLRAENLNRVQGAVRERAAADVELAEQAPGVEAAAESQLEQLETVREVAAEEGERATARADFEKQQAAYEAEQAGVAEQERARRAIGEEAKFPFAPTATRPTKALAPEAVTAAEQRTETERAAAEKRAATEKAFPTMPEVMRERVAPPAAPPKAPVAPVGPVPPERSAAEQVSEAQRRIDERAAQEPEGPPAPSQAVTEAKKRTEWRRRYKATFELTDEEAILGEAVREVFNIPMEKVDPGGVPDPTEIPSIDSFFRKRNKYNVPPGFKPTFDAKTGHLKGAPHIKTEADLIKLREQLDQLANQGEEAKHWYDTSEFFFRTRTESEKEKRRLAQATSIHSPKNSVRQNLVDMARSAVQAFYGMPLDARNFAAIPKKIRAVFEEFAYELGRKTWNFGENLFGDLDKVTVDDWIKRAFNYEWTPKMEKGKPVIDPKTGEPVMEMKGVEDTEYDWMEWEIRRMAQERGWRPAEVQAAIWAAQKVNETPGMTMAEAKRDFLAFASEPEHLAHVAWEAKPGTSTNQLPEMFEAAWHRQEAFTRAMTIALNNDDGVNQILMDFGLLEGTPLTGIGWYRPQSGPREGQLLRSPGVHFRVIAPSKMSSDPPRLDDATRAALNAAAAAQSIATFQDVTPWHAPLNWGGARVDDVKIVDIRLSRPLTEAEQEQLTEWMLEETQKLTQWVNKNKDKKVGRGKKKKDAPRKMVEGDQLQGWEITVPMPGPTGLRVIAVHDDVGRSLRDAVAAATARLPDDVEVHLEKSYGERGPYLEVNWKEDPDGEGHRELGSAGRSDVSDAIRASVAGRLPRTQLVIDLAAEIYGWTPNRKLHPGYGGWKPSTDAKLRAQLREVLESGLNAPDVAADGREGPPDTSAPAGTPAPLAHRKVTQFPEERARPARFARALEALDRSRAAMREIWVTVDNDRRRALKQEVDEQNQIFLDYLTPEESTMVVHREGVSTKARQDIKSERRLLSLIERRPGWRFKPDLRDEHAKLLERIKKNEELLALADRSLYRGEEFSNEEDRIRQARYHIDKAAKLGGEWWAATDGAARDALMAQIEQERAALRGLITREEGQAIVNEMWGGEEGWMGVMQLRKDGTAVIRGLTNPDSLTGIHELAHVARRLALSDVERTRLERVYGVKDGLWLSDHEEQFAEDWESYVYGIYNPPKLVRPLFEKIREGLQKLWGRINYIATGDLRAKAQSMFGGTEDADWQRGVMEGMVAKINPEIRQFFDEKVMAAADRLAPRPAGEPARATPAATTTTRGPRGPPAVLGIKAPGMPEEIDDLLKPGVVARHMRRFFGKYFTKESLTPKTAYQLHESARSEYRAHLLQASYAATDWKRAWEKAGRTEKDRAAVKRVLEGDQSALADLSTPEMRSTAEVMRIAIDGIQDLLLRSGAIDPGTSLEATVERSIGTYLTTRYRAFTEPDRWNFEAVKEKHPEILANARKWLEGQLEAQGVAGAYEEQLDARLRQFFPQGGADTHPFALIEKVGRKDLSSFMHKKDLPEVLKQLLGEHDDPVTNFVQTYQNIAQIVINHKMLADLARVGEAQGWLVPEDRAIGELTVPFVPDSAPHSPAAGMVTTPEIADAWKRLTTRPKITSGMYRWYLRQLGNLRRLKTVWNFPSGHVGNVLGNYPLMMSNGNWGVVSWGKNKQAWAVARDAAFGDIFKNADRTRELALFMTRKGITGGSVSANDLRELSREAEGLGDVFDDPTRRAASATSAAFDRMDRLYGSEDDGPKVLSFLVEVVKHKAIYPNMPNEQLWDMVADKVKDTMPTWSRINNELRTKLRRSPFGNFISFPLEVMRTRVNAAEISSREVREGLEMKRRGKAAGSLDQQEQGARLVRMGAVRGMSNILVTAGAFAAVGELSKMLWGIGDDDEDDLRRGFAPWEKFTPKWYLESPKNGIVSYVDLGAISPFGSITKPLTAIAKAIDKGPEAAFREGLAEFLMPFADTDFMAQLLIDLVTGREHEGGIGDIIRGERMKETGVIWNKGDPMNAYRIAMRIGQEASLLNFGKRLNRALSGESSQSGQATKPWQEILGQATRFRVSVRDWRQTLQHRRRDYTDDLREATSFFTRPAERTGEPNKRQITNGFHAYVSQRIERQREIYLDIRAARRAGLPEDELYDALTLDNRSGSGLSEELADNLLGATLLVPIPETTHGDPMYDELVEIGQDAVRAYREKYKDEGLTIELELD